VTRALVGEIPVGSEFATRLRAARTAAGLTQERLAHASQIAVRTISDLERGLAPYPRADTVRRLADALDLSGPTREEFERVSRRPVVVPPPRSGAERDATAAGHPPAHAAGNGARRIRVEVLGPVRLLVDGEPAALTPLTKRVLARLVVAGGEAVSIERLYADVWDTPAGYRPAAKLSRNDVQKRVVELRRAMGGGDDPQDGPVLRTETVTTGRANATHYRLILREDQLDSAEFHRLVGDAMVAGPASALAGFAKALSLWRGAPMPELAGHSSAEPAVGRLLRAHTTARTELARAYVRVGRLDNALPLLQALVDETPDDASRAAELAAVRERRRSRHGDEIVRREFPALHTSVTIRQGDLFEQDDANIVVGFGNTFDTSTTDDIIISRTSVQGQLLHRLYGGDARALDADLRKALRSVKPLTTETAQDKPRGKRVRYPVGTVAMLPRDGRRVFAVAYSRQRNDLVVQSSPEDLRASLRSLWKSVASWGLLLPVAMPVVGSGLARIAELGREELMILAVDSFLEACRVHAPLTPELRFVLPAADLERTRVDDVSRFLEALDTRGMGG
jgi:transcriptional regulator with XRE-family HTH domain/DNA-binding SARP family transcriptional activator